MENKKNEIVGMITEVFTVLGFVAAFFMVALVFAR